MRKTAEEVAGVLQPEAGAVGQPASQSQTQSPYQAQLGHYHRRAAVLTLGLDRRINKAIRQVCMSGGDYKSSSPREHESERCLRPQTLLDCAVCYAML